MDRRGFSPTDHVPTPTCYSTHDGLLDAIQEEAQCGGMLKFYMSLFRDIPHVFRSKAEAAIFWILTFGAPIAVYFYPDWKHVTEGEALSRWYVLAPIAVSILYGLARANYEKYEALNKLLREAYEYEKGRRQHGAIRTALGNSMRSFVNIQNFCVTGEMAVADLRKELHDQSEQAFTFVQQFFDGGEAALLISPTLPPLDLNAQALIREHKEDLATIYLTAKSKAQALERLIDKTRPSIPDSGAPMLPRV